MLFAIYDYWLSLYRHIKLDKLHCQHGNEDAANSSHNLHNIERLINRC